MNVFYLYLIKKIKTPVACKVDEYLGGLLWNLQTYQDGVCTDYGYNYGRRMSPTAEEIVNYFMKAQQNNTRIIGRSELLGDTSIPPLNAGLSCLAALPSEVQHLVPEPYRRLSVNSSVEEIYALCMDPEANVFDIQTFQRLCMDFIEKTKGDTEIAEISRSMGSKDCDEDPSSIVDTNVGRKILTSDRYWTVFQKITRPITHPFAPPKPFSSRLSQLKPNNRIKVSRVLAADKPRHLNSSEESKKNDFRYSDANGLLLRGNNKNGEELSLENIPYKVAYTGAKEAAKRRNAKNKTKNNNNNTKKMKDQLGKTGENVSDSKKSKHRHRLSDEEARMRQIQMTPPPSEPSKNIDGLTAVQCLQQLKDVQLLSIIQWEWIAPSQTPYASFNPEAYETVKLTIKVSNISKDSDNDTKEQEELVLEQDRNVNEVSRKILKQGLASLALQKLLQVKKSWTEMNMSEMKEQLSVQNPVIQ